ncbi:MAG: DUF1501 domain-containing protein, partial [Planctomycetaceae bacterium]|nr:DUF1501 domain-containing protein [Planctomycetaceae bacterium]
MFQFPSHVARRSFLQTSGVSLGSMALSSLMAQQSFGQEAGIASGSGAAVERWKGVLTPHFPPRAKRIIWLYMAGGMTHIDTFDNKPKLAELHGQPMPESVTKGQQIAQLQGQKLNCFAPQHPFKTYGQSGQSIAEIWPMLGEKCADDMCIVRSLHTDAINHDPAHTFMNTGTMIAGRPAMGSWLLYGL